MAEVTKATNAGHDGSNPAHPQIAGDFVAGEAIARCDLVYIAADGKVYRADGTAADIKARCPRLAPFGAAIGRQVTMFQVGIRYRYAAAGTLTPGSLYYLSAATPGRLSTTTTTGDATGTVQAVSDTDVVLIRSL